MSLEINSKLFCFKQQLQYPTLYTISPDFFHYSDTWIYYIKTSVAGFSSIIPMHSSIPVSVIPMLHCTVRILMILLRKNRIMFEFNDLVALLYRRIQQFRQSCRHFSFQSVFSSRETSSTLLLPNKLNLQLKYFFFNMSKKGTYSVLVLCLTVKKIKA